MRKILKKCRRFLNKLSKQHPRLRDPLRAFMNFYRLLRYKYETILIKTDPRIIVFSSFGGQSYSDNPRALFECMLECDIFKGYTFVWGLKNNLPGHRKRFRALRKNIIKSKLSILHPEMTEEEFSYLYSAYAVYAGNNANGTDNPLPVSEITYTHEQLNIFFREIDEISVPMIVTVKYNEKTWRKYLARSKYWILNFKIEDYLKPKDDQIFVQTWHGTPLKRLGFDLEHFDNVLNTSDQIKKRYGIEIRKISYFISPSPFATEKFKSAWCMEQFGKGNIIVEEGYPRNDVLFSYTREQADRCKLKLFGYYYLEYEKYVKKKKIVLYAPTYRSDQHTSGVGYTYHYELDFDRMRAELGDDYIIVFRAHYFIANKFNFGKYAGFVYNGSNIGDINDLYIISDIMVTDYSSSMFDYANLRRPMIFYMYDFEHYRDESNGFYFNPEKELPGPIVRTEDELIEAIREAGTNFTYSEKYRKFNEKFDPLDDGHVCERVVDRIFRQNDSMSV